MRWGPVALGCLMSVVGVSGVAVAARRLLSGEQRPMLIAVLGAILALLGVGLIRDARHPRAPGGPDEGEAAYSSHGPSGDVGASHDADSRSGGDGGGPGGGDCSGGSGDGAAGGGGGGY